MTGNVSESDDNSAENIDSTDTAEQLRRWTVAASTKQHLISDGRQQATKKKQSHPCQFCDKMLPRLR